MYGLRGLMYILKEMSNQWKNNREGILNSSEKLLKRHHTVYISITKGRFK